MARSRIADEQVQRREKKPELGKGKAFSVQTTRPWCSDKLHSGKSNYNNARIQVSKLMLLWKHTTLAVLTKLPFFLFHIFYWSFLWRFFSIQCCQSPVCTQERAEKWLRGYRDNESHKHSSPASTLCDKCVGSLTSPANLVTLKMQEMWLTVCSRCPRRLECLTINRCSYKGTAFSSVILRPWVLVRSGVQTLFQQDDIKCWKKYWKYFTLNSNF